METASEDVLSPHTAYICLLLKRYLSQDNELSFSFKGIYTYIYVVEEEEEEEEEEDCKEG